MGMPRPAPGTGRWWVVGVLGCGVAVALIVGVNLSGAGARVSATTTAFKVLDDASVQVSFDVTKPPEVRVTCTIRAVDSHFTAVGSAQVDVPPAAEATTHLVGIVRTTTRAVSGVVQDCVRA